MKKIINKYLLLFLCIFSLVLPTGCEVKEQKQVVVDYQEYHFRNENLLEIIYVFLTIFLYLLKCPQSLIL